ncbi:excinuclease [Atopomonas sediminilitoris]|uniref:excinuclease n=1 Tax=Atopomonas sediminilitoris TaxID=2919919 RepID=UPI001F4E5DF9|nr:excinuclease [Atopomonas sediminilitoris]MCJ8170383.1 excinuclease [Atopomonas sediminilitoris]
MKSLKLCNIALVGALTVAATQTANARDTALFLDFDSVVAEATQAGRLDGSVKFYLTGETLPGKASIVREVVTNKKTNAFNKSDEEACSWVLQSALITLQDAAKAAGANAVTDIVSFYKRKEYKSSKQFECHAGAFVAGTALKGNLANVK